MEYSKATTAEADLVVRLFELRREPVMRQARNWFMQFQPKTVDDVLAVANAYGTQENAYFRQITSFWETLVTLPLHQAVNRDLFVEWNGEFIFVYAKFYPFLAELREKMGNPGFLQRCEQLIAEIPGMKDNVQAMIKRMAQMAAGRK